MPFLGKNISLIAIKYLFCSAMLSTTSNELFENQIQANLNAFYPLLRIQSLYAVLWRQNSGKIKSLKGYDSLQELEQWANMINENENLLDSYVQIELHSLRKIFITVYTLKETYFPTLSNSKILKRIFDCSSDSQEL